MSDWIEENNDHILEGHGDKFVVGHVLCSKQIPPKWKIKQSPFLLDVHKKFATLGEAKEYCEQRYQELFGHDDEITRLRADLAAVTKERDRMREAVKPLIEIEDYPDTILMKRIRDLRAAAAALEGVTEPASPWRDIESAPRDKEILVFGKKDDGTDYQEVCEYYDAANCWPIVLMHGYLAPTHWMPLPEPPR